MKELKVGLLGLGQIGSGVYQILRSKSSLIRLRSGVSLKLVKIAEKNSARVRQVKPKGVQVVSDAMDVIRDPNINVVIELIGGIHPAKEFILAALRAGKDVVTANKALLAEEGREIFAEANRLKRNVYFEASVGGGIPVIKAIREALIANRITSVQSIINGTTNYILTKMSEEHLEFDRALKLAQQKGYAEANPTLDIEGIDAAHKISILASLVFGGWTPFKRVHVSGMSKIRSEDIAFAKEFGYVIKLLAVAKSEHGKVELRVEPTLLPKGHILSNVHGSFNAVLMKGDEVGDLLLYGRGAGSFPTGSAVVSDLVDLAKLRANGNHQVVFPSLKLLNVRPVSTVLSRYYLRVLVVDRPGVLSKIAAILGRCKVSISDVIQRERRVGSVVPVILLTHGTLGESIRRAVQMINQLLVTKGKVQVIRIEGES
ncbi:MAG: homoserine dehydrogenase [Omnitrophica bacterium RIFCSPLOWO2_12_FULL_44_17]|uniref:Homoserine dehydrogenase n=1 Tax=Candidatus Danuiimicrobium aquiferis TaxID=1801832 RepID=A0A1G1L2P0_9BACT|nr:MAG: homoserine dehydrogenase [Omnitrophica bacterium RIFCSPHIGHO2_02_FULL_45_28]OGW88254.1 MAG: homoserine dehydrogenase [Omnitrophica bacterium RIFCSPHIGHO2_12_FULL_44_12]OGW99139.1 MAG: homoserine dehydrogenase [Omnitrophica bacterium RIFCSPLOWO2_12_FULL_44_17]OGX03168.1 MAG: homoserine dehydrogenase [Omnitrophica bacterium RIFCSPLOWO2_02_FULL_44_11]